MALSIMLYHLSGSRDASTPLGKLGLYGVSIFFILSGLSMAIAYDRFICDLRSSIRFFIRRIFRIWPLLWLAIFIVVVPAYFTANPISFNMIFLNVTTLFGFIAPTECINMGAWSIGNEMVYYAFTPFLIMAYKRHMHLGNALTILATVIGLVFAFYILDGNKPLAPQWSTYVNPFNNLFLYCAGLAMYFNLKEFNFPNAWRLPFLFLVIAGFIAWPSSKDHISIATGMDRVAMSLLSISIVLAFYKCAPKLPAFIGDNFEKLGIATYGVYILHPIIMNWVRATLISIDHYHPYLNAALTVLITIMLALVSFRFFETPLIKFGKSITNHN